MTARALVLVADPRCLVAGLVVMVIGVLAFPVVVVLAVATAAVSGAWFALPCLAATTGVTAVLAWVVFGDGAAHLDAVSDPGLVPAQQWTWYPLDH